ncbi:hypothetical protein [Pseudodesulfovibrio portus]|uniref:DUF4180 domain-containing protein n=1 Tax=Pseudodesulfovibrio portus TaxID=231439 RepID=A0ABM8AUK5_9BACT|nr:hypothetical protein [Pseudodesulfovibrio portus]BDQ35101.1 hypothetical protein JCM14722_26430 [Pseudodesulfovibrio portus]
MRESDEDGQLPPCKIALETKPDYILCTCEGVLDGPALLDLAEKSLRNRLDHNLNGILADIRKSTSELSMYDAVQFGECLAELASPAMRGRIAIVHDHRGEAAARLFETALINRSFTVRLFSDSKAAASWFTGKIDQDPAGRQ